MSNTVGHAPGRSMIVIGAGIAGLSAGCYAQMNGYRSRIFEMRAKPGGLLFRHLHGPTQVGLLQGRHETVRTVRHVV